MASVVIRTASWIAVVALATACAGHSHDATNGATDNGTGTDGNGSGGAQGQGPGGTSGIGGGGGSSDGGTGTSSYAHVYVAPSYSTLFAISDVHGHLAQLTTLLARGGLISASSSLTGTIAWTGNDATLVVVGDMIDKGPASLEVLSGVMGLQIAAQNAGGHVVVLLGNHEAEFLGSPTNKKFTGQNTIDDELSKLKPAITPASFASGADPRGAWMRTLPIAAKIDGWFFSHAGQSGGKTLSQIDASVTSALASTAGYQSLAFIGVSSILEADDWYTSTAVVDQNLHALGATHIAFGHDPNAFGLKGVMYAPPAFYGKLFRLDAGLGAGDSDGELLRVRHSGTDEVAEAILPDGTTRVLFQGPH